eukprot:2183823-Pyramimonas_sp.AAC.1
MAVRRGQRESPESERRLALFSTQKSDPTRVRFLRPVRSSRDGLPISTMLPWMVVSCSRPCRCNRSGLYVTRIPLHPFGGGSNSEESVERGKAGLCL